MSISIQSELLDDYAIKLSDDAIAKYIRRYQVMLAARQQDPQALRRQYESVDEIVLSIDGLQPEKGHETLYVVRELTQKRVWFAKPLISATADEVQRLIAQAKEWATSLNKTVSLWISDKQDAFVTGIAADFLACRIATATTIFSAIWPSLCWRLIVTPRFRCDTRCAGCGKSNKPCSNGRMPRR